MRILGALACIAIMTTIYAWTVGTPDRTMRGACVGLLYLAVLVIIPGSPTILGQSVFLVGLAVQLSAKAALALRTTVTGPVYVAVEERGPYRVVRHPMSLGELIMGCALIAENPITSNILAGLFLVWSKVVMTRMEEGFLKQYFEYREYCRHVKYRMVPGIW